MGIGDAASLIRILCDDDIKLFAAASGDIGPMHPAPTHMRPVASSAKVVLLAAVETVNSAMPATLDAAALSVMAIRGQITGAKLDGPLAFDNAVDLVAAHMKGIVSPVAGQADILVAPDLEAGNMLAKQLIYLGGADAAGLVLGARVPIILTSRSDSAGARTASIAFAKLVAKGRSSR